MFKSIQSRTFGVCFEVFLIISIIMESFPGLRVCPCSGLSQTPALGPPSIASALVHGSTDISFKLSLPLNFQPWNIHFRGKFFTSDTLLKLYVNESGILDWDNWENEYLHLRLWNCHFLMLHKIKIRNSTKRSWICMCVCFCVCAPCDLEQNSRKFTFLLN